MPNCIQRGSVGPTQCHSFVTCRVTTVRPKGGAALVPGLHNSVFGDFGIRLRISEFPHSDPQKPNSEDLAPILFVGVTARAFWLEDISIQASFEILSVGHPRVVHIQRAPPIERIVRGSRALGVDGNKDSGVVVWHRPVYGSYSQKLGNA